MVELCLIDANSRDLYTEAWVMWFTATLEEIKALSWEQFVEAIN
jgi:hypothetical protein